MLVPGKTPALLVGNEGWGYAEICAGPYERVLYQTFSCPRSRATAPLLWPKSSPIAAWHPASASAPSAGSRSRWATMASPAHRSTCPPSSPTRCAPWPARAAAWSTPPTLMMDPADGLRAINDVDQLAAFEFAATFTSQGVRNVLSRTSSPA